MLPEIRKAYLDGRLMLFLGAGASADSLDSDGNQIPMADGLAQELSAAMGWNYAGEGLSIVYSAFHSIDPKRLHSHMRRRFTNTRPSSALQILASYPWSRVYTANIDDCFETAVRRSRKQRIHICTTNSPLEELDPIFQTLQLIKLNGTAERPEDGFIFSPQEYGEGSSRLPAWYRELAQDYSSYTFVFLGSRLNEPLLQHAIAEMRQDVHRSPLPGYVITPSASDIEKHHLKGLRLSHVQGGVGDFASWMRKEISNVPTGWDLALARRPELRNLGGALSDSQKRALNSVTVVSADTLPRTLAGGDAGPIRNFYRGYKPRWTDILDNVPANISFIEGFKAELQKKHDSGHCFALVGQAGSGKTTAMMTVALHLSQTDNYPVYFLREPVSNIGNVIRALEELNAEKYYLFIDKIDSMHKNVADSIKSSLMKNGCIVFSERVNIWTRRVRQVLGPHTSGSFSVKRISRNDARSILQRIEKFGPWTRLQGMSVSDRMDEIFHRADRQLLIGLLEATTGMGFTQIIRRDFASMGNDEHKKFLVLVGLASIHRARISPNMVGRALANMDVMKDVNRLVSEVEGIVVSQRGNLTARHSVYVRELFEKIVEAELIKDCLIALLLAYADHEAPVIKNVSKEDGTIFKSIINHRFVREMMRSDELRVRAVYEVFETKFHVDGLYWLQYGLALRGFGHHVEALSKLATAREAFTSPQIEHAYGQQLLIMAENAATKNDAEIHLEEAVSILRSLSSEGWEGDTYPIVSLAEGHIRVVKKFDGMEAARKRAKEYGNMLLAAKKTHSNERLEQAVTTVVKFAATGDWTEKPQFDYLESD